MKRKARAKESVRSTIIIHSAIAGLSAIVLLGCSFILRDTFGLLSGSAFDRPETLEIGMEYDSDIEMTWTFSRTQSGGFVLLQSDEHSPVAISLPAEWELTEVRNVAYDTVKPGDELMGFVRWELPATAGLMLSVPSLPDQIQFVSPSEHTATLTLNAVDLLSDSIIRNIRLMQHEAFVDLWQESE